MDLTQGSALQVEDLNVTLKVVTFSPFRAQYKKKGKVSKRRFKNMLRMANKNYKLPKWSDLGKES